VNRSDYPFSISIDHVQADGISVSALGDGSSQQEMYVELLGDLAGLPNLRRRLSN
jgi:hypothetical protein